jgi:tRNA (guanine-N7-)-methyltransferase
MQAPRRIRSFVLRAGRVTAGQERALSELWPRYGVEFSGAPLDLDATVGRLLLQAEQDRMSNLRVICHDAVEVLRESIPDRGLDEVLVFFPDPWHKKRHHKRRLIEAQFVACLREKLQPGGILRLATDWQAYAEQMLAVCNADGGLVSLSAQASYVARPEFRPVTRFERRGERLGHGVWDLAYARAGAPAPG